MKHPDPYAMPPLEPVLRTRRERIFRTLRNLRGGVFFLLLCLPGLRHLPEALHSILFLLGCLTACICVYYDMRRLRPRRRWMMATIVCGGLGILWLAIMPPVFHALDPADRELVLETRILGGCMALAAIPCYLFGRRSVARAELRFYALRKERARRRRTAPNR